MKTILKLVTGISITLAQVWAAGALYFRSFPGNSNFRAPCAIAYLVSIFLAIIFTKKHFRALLISLIPFLAIAFWFASIKPPVAGVYPPNLAMPWVEFNGDLVTIHNVRNNDYRAPEDYDVRYEARTYDLAKLRTIDMFVNYWGMDAIAHTFVSFGFSDGRYLAVSIEIRPEVGERYNEFAGLFKEYELIYIWGDERDLVRLRTNYRKEDAYLYRASLSEEQIKKLFISMLERTNELREHPEFYNTVTQSCTNAIGGHIIKAEVFDLPWWKRRILTGSVDRRMYEEGRLMTWGKEFTELRVESFINGRGQAADQFPDFSDRIRTHLT